MREKCNSSDEELTVSERGCQCGVSQGCLLPPTKAYVGRIVSFFMRIVCVGDTPADRPLFTPGHHAEPDQGMGFCIFNNIAVAASHLMEVRGVKRIGIIDFDVHHGNGTQKIFEADPRVLFVSIHQDGNYPLHSGKVEETGSGAGEGYTINVPLPPGSGSGAYRASFERIIEPAMSLFKPEVVLVSCGFDASYLDPLSAQILGSMDYAFMTRRIMNLADEFSQGRCLFLHEGGYSEVYVPFCGLAVLETLTGFKTSVEDPYSYEVTNWGGQEIQVHQDALIEKVLSHHQGFKRLAQDS